MTTELRKNKAETIWGQLAQCIGTEHYYRHDLMRGFYFTDGIKAMAELCKGYWLIDVVASYQIYHAKRPFQVWELKVEQGELGSCRTGVITMQEDAGEPVKVRLLIPHVDFPLDFIKLFVVKGVLLLPSEY